MLFHFAWITAAEMEAHGFAFHQVYKREDEKVFVIDLDQSEGDFCHCSIEVENAIEAGQAVGLLSAGRSQWFWISFSDGAGGNAEPLFLGRVVGIPTNIVNAWVTLEFEARPSDFNAQKAAVADSLRVLPGYDPIFIDPQRRDDVDATLEGYPRAWHTNRVTLVVGTSDFNVGEDGEIEYTADEIDFDGLSIAFQESPPAAIAVEAKLEWTQLATGSLDLTSYVRSNWPNEKNYGTDITSFSLSPANWPQTGASLQRGWTVEFSECVERYPLDILSRSGGGKTIINWGPMGGGGTTTVESRFEDQYVAKTPPGSIPLSSVVTSQSTNISKSGGRITSFGHSVNWSDGITPLHHLIATLRVTYEASRPCSEIVRFTLTADAQPIVTLIDDGEPETITLNSVNLSEPIDSGDTDPQIPIGDARRRSYICTERGIQSLQHMILRARARHLQACRAVHVSVAPLIASFAALQKFAGVTLRNNVKVHDWRIPYGVASGKVVEYAIKVDGDAGAIDAKITIACPIGYGGAIEAAAGTGRYVDAAAMGPDLQEFVGRTELIESDTSVGYSPPSYAPNDDGMDFIAGITVASAIEQGITVEHPPAEQRQALTEELRAWQRTAGTLGALSGDETRGNDLLSARTDALENVLESLPTTVRFKLHAMNASFETQHDIAVTELKLPTGIWLQNAPP